MNLVHQRHVDGCGVAAYAMVTRKTYEEALATLHPKSDDWRAETSLNDLLTALSADGFETVIRPRCPIGTLKTAILHVRYRIGKTMFMHVVVWDAEKQAVLDPWEERPFEEYQEGLCLAFELTPPLGTSPSSSGQ